MSISTFFTPNYITDPQSFADKAYNGIQNFFDLTNASAIETALKVLAYATAVIPAVVFVIKFLLDSCAPIKAIIIPIKQEGADISSIPNPTETDSLEIGKVVNQAPVFKGYVIGDKRQYELTNAHMRPANLFFDALLGKDSVTLPGGKELFAINNHRDAIDTVGDLGFGLFDNEPVPEVITVKADNTPCKIKVGKSEIKIPLNELYGKAEFKISLEELRSVLASQKIYIAPLLPIAFYKALKAAMLQDKIVILPRPATLRAMKEKHCAQVIKNAQEDWESYGFESKKHCDELLNLTLYQLGSLVVKTEDYYLLTDPDGKIRTRNPGDNDAIRLINACGIRNVKNTSKKGIANSQIMQQTFSAALIAAEKGFVVFPAVGMGVWAGDPELYWPAFLDAVIANGSSFTNIFVNPRHQKTPDGTYAGRHGDEFQIILDNYKKMHANDDKALSNLNKIVNLYAKQTDVLHLSQQLKKAFPNEIISLFNASDPDVTLGYHVGEYVNSLGAGTTTEENYTALGTNGLCFETITEIHKDPNRIIQVHMNKGLE